jgi:hypothetical protein
MKTQQAKRRAAPSGPAISSGDRLAYSRGERPQ